MAAIELTQRRIGASAAGFVPRKAAVAVAVLHPKAAAIETIKEFGWTEKADLVFI